MKSKKALLKRSSLYVIIDKDVLGNKPPARTAVALRNSGADIVQLRDKTSDKRAVFEEAKRLRKLFSGSSTLFIVNDFVDIALAVHSDGVHLGQHDIPIEAARSLLGQDMIIGISCHDLSQALKAQKEGADYIGIGPVFPTPTKPDLKPHGLELIQKCKNSIKIPFFAIGGINTRSIDSVISAGAKRVAVCSAIIKAHNISQAVQEFNLFLSDN